MSGNHNSGRKKAPAAYRELQGQTVATTEPRPDDGVIVPPSWLNEAEREVWDRLAPDMIRKKVLTAWDVDRFVAFITAVVLMNDARQSMDNYGTTIVTPERELANGTIIFKTIKNPAFTLFTQSVAIMNQIGGSFGLSPADRARIQIAEPDGPDDPTAKFF